MSASDLIGSFGREVTVTRYAAGDYVDGTYVPGSTSTFDTVMSVQQMRGRELLNLPEGQRTRHWVKAYASVELFNSDQSESKKADTVTVDSVVYEVHRVEYWEATGSGIAPHWRIEMVKVNPS